MGVGRSLRKSGQPRYPRTLKPSERAPTVIQKLLAPVLVLAALVVLSGCGGGGGGGGSSSGGSGGGGSNAGVNGISVGNCLNENYDFLVQPSTDVLNGQSPAGANFTLTFYKTPAAAAAAAKNKSKKTTAVVENAVVDFKGNPSPYQGAPPAKVSKVELGNMRTCIDQSKK